MSTNFHRTAAWLAACGKEPGDPAAISVQLACHIEEIVEFLSCVGVERDGRMFPMSAYHRILHHRMLESLMQLDSVASAAKAGQIQLAVHEELRVQALDALCDTEVTGNGVAYLCGMDKPGADAAVLDSNDAKLVDGKPVILQGGKIGKPEGWKAPDLRPFASPGRLG